MTEVDLSEAIDHGVVVRPGDTLLVVAPASTTPDELRDFREMLRERLLDSVKCCVLAGVEQ